MALGSYFSSPNTSAAMVVNVPAQPTNVFADAIGTISCTSAKRSATYCRAASTSSGVGGSDCMMRSEIRTHPIWEE